MSMMNSKHLNVPLTAVRGVLETRRKIAERIGYYEKLKVTVRKRMPGKGFNPAMVAAALAQCEDMVEFYRDMLEMY